MRKTLALCLVPLLAASALAQPPSPASVDRLLAATEARKLGDSVIVQVQDMLKPMFEHALESSVMKPSADKQLVLPFYEERFARRATAMLQEELGWQRMREVNRAIYLKAFTQAEIDGLIAFYESPAGRASVEKMPIAVQQAMDEMQQRLVPLMLKLRMAAQQQVDEMAEATAHAAAAP